MVPTSSMFIFFYNALIAYKKEGRILMVMVEVDFASMLSSEFQGRIKRLSKIHRH